MQEKEKRNATLNLILCFIVPFYSVYWMYKSAECVDMLTKAENKNSNLVTWCVILEIFIPIVPPILIQDKMNNIGEKENSN